MPEDEREQIVNRVEKLETAEYKLLHFQMDYSEYLSMNRKYSLEKTDGTWTITGVEQDKVTIGSDETGTDAAAKLDALKYQTHEGMKINYRDKVLVFNGWE